MVHHSYIQVVNAFRQQLKCGAAPCLNRLKQEAFRRLYIVLNPKTACHSVSNYPSQTDAKDCRKEILSIIISKYVYLLNDECGIRH
jgi:hypothetical protein